MIPYPSSSVWYIRVSSKGESGQGSGVGIRLKRKLQPGTEETFILTCAHVIRRKGKNDQELGPRYENLWVYPAGYGYEEADGIPVEPVTSVIPLKTYSGNTFYNQPVEDIETADWALLAFTELNWSHSRTSHSLTRRWHLTNLELGDQCVISGYPEGEAGFAGHNNGNDNIVRPKPGYALQTIEKVVDNIITFDGTHSRSGMSGGGVFRKDGENYSLCGLHRARHDESLQLKAVSIQSILLRLNELGYEPVEVPAPKSEASWYWAIWQYLNNAPELFAKLQIAKGFVTPSAYVGRVVEDGVFRQKIIEWFTKILCVPVENHSTTLLLGGYGSGKSSVLHVLGRDMAQNALSDYPEKPIPIYCRLDACRGKTSLAEGVAAFLARYSVNISPASVSELFNDPDHQVVLLLDGLDEYCDRVDYQRVSQILAMLDEARGLSALQLVISCRDTFFPSADDIAIVHPDTIVKLAQFSDEQVSEYLQLWQPALPVETASILETSQHLKDVCRSPIHLFLFCKYVSKLTPEDFQKAATGTPVVRRVDLYRSFTLETLSADQAVAARWPISERRVFLRELAFHWHDKSISEWSLSELKLFATRSFGTMQPDQAQVEECANSIFNCSFFTRVGDRFRFSHKSFQEFLIAEALADEMKTGKFSKWETPMYNEVYFFGAELLRPTPEMLTAVFSSNLLRTQGNVLATMYNVPSPDVDSLIRKLALTSPYTTVRQVAVQALGFYRHKSRVALSLDEQAVGLTLDIQTALSAYRVEKNTIIRATLQLIMEWSKTQDVVLQSADRDALLTSIAEDSPLERKDAEDILDVRTDSRIIPLYRKAAMQLDHRWPSVIGGILLLGTIQDTDSRHDLEQVIKRSTSNEVRRAWQIVSQGWGQPSQKDSQQ
ncbi:MAG: NACHT domain-containing protein [Pirellulales bacterium]|nr:NACHT domain-containing protein [Pirellulales bacterium]